MNIKEIGDVFHCDCGFSWSRGKNGNHNCANGLREKVRQLAAENVGLKKFIQTDCFVGHIEPETFYEEEVTRYVSADGYEPETPATDAVLTELRNEAGARAVELFAKTLGSPYSFRDEKCYEDGFTRAIEIVRDAQAPRFAKQLREGAK
ncbi:TPA: hypothetical protein ACF3KJ_003027 [Klebsiella quasipneumoniae subsp. similipneumoniae]|uniref:hypothetical protein n=1 Tax=Raoultella ornithinolytica TaxID=54291 RepID=UPI0027EEBC7B|nr:hypothetical protein [Raoultella ornithinolytica]MEB7957316.1 hypothetical protein [Raoultella ornithinolytica]HDU3774745.1 hypothetical protein [Klebsiella quasipneumoniae subsp. similipneumoniae]